MIEAVKSVIQFIKDHGWRVVGVGIVIACAILIGVYKYVYPDLAQKSELEKLTCLVCRISKLDDSMCYESKCLMRSSFNLDNQTYKAILSTTTPAHEMKRPNAAMQEPKINIFDQTTNRYKPVGALRNSLYGDFVVKELRSAEGKRLTPDAQTAIFNQLEAKGGIEFQIDQTPPESLEHH